jgi:hypothetical protein
MLLLLTNDVVVVVVVVVLAASFKAKTGVVVLKARGSDSKDRRREVRGRAQLRDITDPSVPP